MQCASNNMRAAAGCCGAVHCGPWSNHPQPVQALPEQGHPELCLCEQLEDGHGSLQALQALLLHQEACQV